MAKLTLTPIASGYQSTSVYSANNDLIEAAIENTLSRDGTAPNYMDANIDMNSYRVRNLADAIANQDAVTLNQMNVARTEDLSSLVLDSLGDVAENNAMSHADGTILVADGDSFECRTIAGGQSTTIETIITDIEQNDADILQEISDRGDALVQEAADRAAAIQVEANARIADVLAVNNELDLIGDPNVGNTAFIIDTSTVLVGDASGGTVAQADELHLLGAWNGAKDAFVMDTTTVKIDDDATGDTFSERFTALTSSDDTNAANIISEQNARTSADTAIADEIDLIGAMNGTETAFILNTSTVKVGTEGAGTVARADELALLGAENTGQDAFVLDTSTVYLDADDPANSFAQKITTLEADIDGTEASITTLQSIDTQIINSRKDGSNLLDPQCWVVGTSNSQTSTAGKQDFSAYADGSATNNVQLGTGPYGYSCPLWRGVGDGTTMDGGFRVNSVPIDDKKTYRFSVWFWTDTATPGSWLGPSPTTTNNMNDTQNTNPYFNGGTTLPEASKWYLYVGILHGSGKSGSTEDGISGIYDPVTGGKVVDGTEYKIIASSTTTDFRAIQWATTSTSYWAYPRLEEVNGSEQSISAMLAPAYTVTYRQDAEPTTGEEGDIWIDTNDGNKMYVYASGAWLTAQDQSIATAQSTADGKNTVYYQASQPSSTTAGDVWYDTDDDNKIYVYNGGWQDSRDGSKTKTFAATSAPTAENVGDVWYDTTDGSNEMYRWSGAAWVTMQDGAIASAQSTADGKNTIYYQNDAPVSADEHDIWVDTNDGNKMYVYNSSAWQDAQDDAIGTAQTTADSKAEVYWQAAQPGGGTENDIWVDTDDDNKLYVYKSGAWRDVQDDTIATAQTTADSKSEVYYQAGAPAGTDNDIWIETDNNNKMWVYKSGEWKDAQDDTIATAQSTADGKNTVYYQTTAPSSGMSTNDVWYDTDDGNRQYVYNGSTWVDASDNNKIYTYIQSSAPVSGMVAGDLWLDSNDNNNMYRYSGSAWVDVADENIAALNARYGISLDVDGYVQGFVINNGGAPEVSDFTIRSDHFKVVTTTGSGLTEITPFEVSGSNINLTGSVTVSGTLIVNGTLDLAGANDGLTTGLSDIDVDLGNITAGTITLNATGHIKGGQTAFNTGTGYWLGYTGGYYDFSIGNSSDNYVAYDGSAGSLTVKGDVHIGTYVASDTTRLSATTYRSHSPETWSTLKTFTVDRDGVVRIRFTGYRDVGTIDVYPQWRTTVNGGAADDTGNLTSTTGVTISPDDITVSEGDVIDIDIKGGLFTTIPYACFGALRDAYLKCDAEVTVTGGTVDLD